MPNLRHPRVVFFYPYKHSSSCVHPQFSNPSQFIICHQSTFCWFSSFFLLTNSPTSVPFSSFIFLSKTHSLVLLACPTFFFYYLHVSWAFHNCLGIQSNVNFSNKDTLSILEVEGDSGRKGI